MEIKKCPICGAQPRMFFEITDTEGVKRGTNDFIVGCRLTCSDCGFIDVISFGEYRILPVGQIVTTSNPVDSATEIYNARIDNLAERIRRTAEKMVTKDSYECVNRCTWGANNVCKDHANCAYCPARLPETDCCRCMEVAPGEECPYYEPLETS